MNVSSLTTPQAALEVMSAQANEAPADAADTARPDPLTISLFEEAVSLHTRRLLTIARAIAGNRASAEDVVQQAITNLYQHRARYDWANPAAAGALMLACDGARRKQRLGRCLLCAAGG